MSWFRFFVLLPLPILTTSALLLTGAAGQQTTQPKPPVPAAQPAPPKPDPQAIAAVDKAIELLDPKKVGWLEAKIWEKVDTAGFSFQSEGNFLSGPDYRLHMDLKVRVGGTEGRLTIVSNGTEVWNSIGFGSEDPLISMYNLKEVQKKINSKDVLPQRGDDFYRSQSFQGIVPLLHNIRQQMILTKMEPARFNNRDCQKIAGVWSPAVAKTLSQDPAKSWPGFSPRSCNLYLDKEAPHFLHRVEWLGPTGHPEDRVIMQIEFRDPKILKAEAKAPGQTEVKIPKQFAKAFEFDPGNHKVNVTTKSTIEVLTQSAQKAAQQAAPAEKK